MIVQNTKTRFIIVSGGVISGVGKGVSCASIGKILKEHGYTVTLIKIDPYMNYDAGTLRPTEHGEVWVTEDGGEIDQDLGTYERFLDQDLSKNNSITSGQVYHSVIERERQGKYLGQTVQLIPHVTDEITNRVVQAAGNADFAIVEIGGTVGDYENVPFLFALKTLNRELGHNSFAHVLVTYLPVPSHLGEMKTKPTQQALRLLGEQGITADFIICRSELALDSVRRKKIEEFSHIPTDHIIAAPNIQSVYEMPLEMERQELGLKLLNHFGVKSKKNPVWSDWRERVHTITKPSKRVHVAIIGKYLDIGAYSLTDSYLSICHALEHSGAELNVGVSIEWIDAKLFENATDKLGMIKGFDGVIIPGGFGVDGVDGKIAATSYVRTNKVPYLGLCYGLQLAAVEYARNVCGLDDAHTTEVNTDTPYPVIDILPLQKKILQKNRYGGTMRLGAYKAELKKDTRVYNLYQAAQKIDCATHMVSERHRHRYEVNPAYVTTLEQAGMVFSGKHMRDDGTELMEFVELPSHPFFVATQAHPEFKSRFGNPNPLFFGFVSACIDNADQKAAR